MTEDTDSTDQDDINKGLPEGLKWLVNVPLFIDDYRISRLHDIVDVPLGEREIRIIEKSVDEIEGSEDAEGSEDSIKGEVGGTLLGALTGKISGEEREYEEVSDYSEQTKSYEYTRPSQRLLASLSAMYYGTHENRVKINCSPTDSEWRNEEKISKVPPMLVFLDLPSLSRAEDNDNNLNPTQLIPMAAEFDDGEVVPLHNRLEYGKERPPEYPKRKKVNEGTYNEKISENVEGVEKKQNNNYSFDELREIRNQIYWDWFRENFEPKQTMITLENAASEHGRIDWIAFRVPLTDNGNTLHLHIEPRGDYNTGTFAYNFIKRGYKHGVRIIGVMKSEPDMNVLSIFEK